MANFGHLFIPYSPTPIFFIFFLYIYIYIYRCFPTKAIAVWTSTGDLDHIWIVGSYFHYANGFEEPQAKEITKKGLLGKKGDPMYVVSGRKLA